MDALKLLGSQNLLLHITTFIRRRLGHARYPSIEMDHVMEALRTTVLRLKDMLADGMDIGSSSGGGGGGGIGSTNTPILSVEEIPRLTTLTRYNYRALLDGNSRLPWDYSFLRITLHRILENLLVILYLMVSWRIECEPAFQWGRYRQDLDQQRPLIEEVVWRGGMGPGGKFVKDLLDRLTEKLSR